MPYRIAVFAPNVPDLVTAAGGWLYDQAAAGWRVTVHAADVADHRPLTILGAEVVNSQAPMANEPDNSSPQIIAFAAESYRRDAWVRQSVQEMPNNGITHIMMWGDTPPAETKRLLNPVEHRLSIAARAFKAHARVAADAVSDEVSFTEMLRGVDLRAWRAGGTWLDTAS
jgi:hypothetical protein